MSNKDIISLVLGVLTIVFGFLASYLNTKQNVKGQISKFITDAENEYKDATKAGGRKFAWVVDKAYSLVPAIFKPFITEAKIGEVVQAIFNVMDAFAKAQLNKVVDKVPAINADIPTVKTDKENQVNTESK